MKHTTENGQTGECIAKKCCKEEYRVVEINAGKGFKEWKSGDKGFLSIIDKDGLVTAYEE